MGFQDIFLAKSKHLFWRRLLDDHVVGGQAATPLEPDNDYFVIRVTEMYVRYARKLWRKYSPVVHSFMGHGGREEHVVIGPAQLREWGEGNLDRMVHRHLRLSGPVPFRGGDVSLLVGLYSVPGGDVAKILIDTVGSLTSLGGVGWGQVPQLANLVKGGVERLLSMDEAQLQLGIRDVFFSSNPLRSGFYVGIASPMSEVSVDELWLDDGRLLRGDDPVVAMPYEDHDYLVLQVERRDKREDWASLPSIAVFEEKFAGFLRDDLLTDQTRRERIGATWPGFQQALKDSPDLTEPDKENIALSVREDLKRRLDELKAGNPFFETRSWGETEMERRSPRDFDFVDVADVTDRSEPGSVQRARAALMESFYG